jgi:hypothetical protein
VSTAFHGRRKGKPLNLYEDSAWLVEIDAAERAVDLLLEAKRHALGHDPQHEQVLWARHIERLRQIKRKLDAVCM